MDQKWGCYQHQQVSFKTFIMYREEGEMLLSNGLLICWFQQIHSILHFSTYCHRKFSAAWFTQNLNWKKGQHFFLQAELLFFYVKALEVISFLSLEITCRRGWEYVLDFAVTVALVYSWDLGKSNALAVLPCGLHIQSPFLGKGTRSRLFREGGGKIKALRFLYLHHSIKLKIKILLSRQKFHRLWAAGLIGNQNFWVLSSSHHWVTVWLWTWHGSCNFKH